jgi:hypothetical protein
VRSSPAGSVAELCKDPAAEAWILAELNSIGKENKVIVLASLQKYSPL